MKKYLFLFVLPFLIFSCGPDYILDQEIEIQNQKWMYADSLTFSVEVNNIDQAYDFHIEVDHLTNYSYRNVYFLLHSITPNGKRITERVSINFMNKIGKWLGDCNSKECDFQSTIREQYKFSQKGKHTFVIEQFMRKNPLEGIESVGLKIEKNSKAKTSEKNN